jgi:uncharacterized protein (DUF433 family)
MALDLQASVLPLRRDSGGVIRIGGTRVTVESVLHAYLEGESAEGILERFPTLDLADVHAVVAWFLRNRRKVEAHLRECGREAEAARAEADRRSQRAVGRKRLLGRRRR